MELLLLRLHCRPLVCGGCLDRYKLDAGHNTTGSSCETANPNGVSDSRQSAPKKVDGLSVCDICALLALFESK